MHPALKKILEIQELDMQMIQLMRLKRQRQRELESINTVKTNLNKQVLIKESEILELKKDIRIGEGEIEEITEKFKKLEAQQSSIKKVEEFNALSHEMSGVEKERAVKEQHVSDLTDKLNLEEDTLASLKENLESTTESSKVLEQEIIESIQKINEEGTVLKEQRELLVMEADPEVFQIYQRLLTNKKDRVVVPIENRCCSGCHIMLTAQHENLVRKGERLAFCEHCSRIHYWLEGQEAEAAEGGKTRRRRTKSATSTAA